MDLVSRVQGILMKPKDEWAKIKDEPTPVAQLFTSYAVILAAIPAIAQFIGYKFIGIKIPFAGWYHFSWGNAFGRAILAYVFALVGVYVFGLIINALAPTFNSTANMNNAMKLAVYSMTPSWVAGIFYILPALWILVMLAGLYGLYILYLGFATPLMNTPKEKVVSYLVISIVVVIVIYVVTAIILGAIFTVGGVYRTL